MMWSSQTVPSLVLDGGSGGNVVEVLNVHHHHLTSPIHLVVVEPVSDGDDEEVTADEMEGDGQDGRGGETESPDTCPYDWSLTYRRLRRASSMISASAVAIDNKIEQAMDLVKSHLMFAVREEVELLKEQIKELTARNAQLEMENSVLRATASSDTLALLKQQRPPPT